MDLAVLITAYFVFVYSTVFHEAAHAWTAHKLGDDTAYLGGQVSLDPIPHFKREPIGMILVPLVSLFGYHRLIGWASAPLDPMWVTRYPRKSALVAVAGPAANIILCIVAAVIMFIGAKNGVFHPVRAPWFHEIVVGTEGTRWVMVANVVSLVFHLNLLLAVLNLMPAPPLDGSNMPLFFLNERAADSYQQMIRQPWMFLVSIVILFRFFPFIFGPVFGVVVSQLYQWYFPLAA